MTNETRPATAREQVRALVASCDPPPSYADVWWKGNGVQVAFFGPAGRKADPIMRCGTSAKTPKAARALGRAWRTELKTLGLT